MILKHLFLVVVFSHIYAKDNLLLNSFKPKPTSLIKTYEKVLDMSLKSLYNEDEREHNITAENIVMSQNCSAAYEQFSTAVINFTRCALNHARPIRICVECVNEYNSSVNLYTNFRKQDKDCEDFFFNSDQVVNVEVLYNELFKLWSKNYCSNCYQSPNLTKEFFEISTSLNNCVKNFNNTGPLNATCEKCHDLYANLSDRYGKFVLSPGDYGNVCMDVVDAMNITRKMWKKYRCIAPFDCNLGYPNIIVILALGGTPFLFYVLAQNVSIIEDVKIVRPKRKFTFANITSTPEPSMD